MSISPTLLSSFNVVSGDTYRFRAQGFYAYRFSIDRHKLQLSDGYFIEPVETDYIIIHTVERYDFLLTAKDVPNKTNYIIRAETLEVNCETLERDTNLESNDAIAVLTYDGNQINRKMIEDEYINGNRNGQTECNAVNPCTVANCPFENYQADSIFNCSNMHINELKLLVPTPENELPDSKDVNTTNFLNFGFDSEESTSTINGRNFIFPTQSRQTQDNGQIDSEFCKNLS